MIFSDKNISKITAKITNATDKITFDGCTTASTTPENAKAQIDKILAIVGKSVDTAGMTRIVTQEAINNG